MKIISFMLLLSVCLQSNPSIAEEAKKTKTVAEETPTLKSFLEKEKKDKFIKSMADFSRDTGINIASDQKKFLVLEKFDLYLPVIGKACTVDTAYQFQTLGYALSRNVEGAMMAIKSYTDTILELQPPQYKAISQSCMTEIQGFSVEISNIFGMKLTPLATTDISGAEDEGEKEKKAEPKEKNPKSLNTLNVQDFKPTN